MPGRGYASSRCLSARCVGASEGFPWRSVERSKPSAGPEPRPKNVNDNGKLYLTSRDSCIKDTGDLTVNISDCVDGVVYLRQQEHLLYGPPLLSSHSSRRRRAPPVDLLPSPNALLFIGHSSYVRGVHIITRVCFQ